MKTARVTSVTTIPAELRFSMLIAGFYRLLSMFCSQTEKVFVEATTYVAVSIAQLPVELCSATIVLIVIRLVGNVLHLSLLLSLLLS